MNKKDQKEIVKFSNETIKKFLKKNKVVQEYISIEGMQTIKLELLLKLLLKEEKNKIKKIIKETTFEISKEIRGHIEEFGKGNNRDIDAREKGTLIIMPTVMKKRLIKKIKDWENQNEK